MIISGGGIHIPGRPLGGGGGPPPFDGNFAPLFPAALVVVQSDRGLSYGATLLPNAGNTSTASMALAGPTPAVPTPIWLRGLAGSVADIYYDGLGVTVGMAGVPWTNGVPIALTGAAAGMTITPSAGTLVAGETWKATCAQLADQTANGKHYVAGAPAEQFLVGSFAGGLCLDSDAIDDHMVSTVALPPAGFFYYSIFQALARGAGFGAYFGSGPRTGELQTSTGAAASLFMFSGSAVLGSNVAMPASFCRVYCAYTGTAADQLKCGSNAPLTGTNTGSGFSSDASIGAFPVGANAAKMRLVLHVISTGALSPAQIAAIDAAVTTKYGASVQV